MIQFVVKLARGHIRKIPSTYPALIEYESRFKIIIDNKIFFDDPNFPLFEFLKYAVEWEKIQTVHLNTAALKQKIIR